MKIGNGGLNQLGPPRRVPKRFYPKFPQPNESERIANRVASSKHMRQPKVTLPKLKFME